MRLYRFIGATTTPIDLKNAVLEIVSGVSDRITVKFGQGNFTWTRGRNFEYVLDKGNLDTVVEGDQVPMEVSFGGTWDYVIGDDGNVTPTDALNGEASAQTWVSTSVGEPGQECAPYCTDLVLTNSPSCSSGIANPYEVNTFPFFRPDSIAYDAEAGTLAVSGKSNAVKPTSLRSD